MSPSPNFDCPPEAKRRLLSVVLCPVVARDGRRSAEDSPLQVTGEVAHQLVERMCLTPTAGDDDIHARPLTQPRFKQQKPAEEVVTRRPLPHGMEDTVEIQE